MTHTFDLKRSLVIVPVFLAGPRGSETFQFAVDTGATGCSVSGLILQQLGYSESQVQGRRHVRTGGGGITAGQVRVQRFGAFGRIHADYPVLWLPLPPTSRIDGLLGLDFFRGLVLELDFARGRITLRGPGSWWRFWR